LIVAGQVGGDGKSWHAASVTGCFEPRKDELLKAFRANLVIPFASTFLYCIPD